MENKRYNPFRMRFNQLSHTPAVWAKKLGFRQSSLGHITSLVSAHQTVRWLPSLCALPACYVPLQRFHLR